MVAAPAPLIPVATRLRARRIFFCAGMVKERTFFKAVCFDENHRLHICHGGGGGKKWDGGFLEEVELIWDTHFCHRRAVE